MVNWYILFIDNSVLLGWGSLLVLNHPVLTLMTRIHTFTSKANYGRLTIWFDSTFITISVIVDHFRLLSNCVCVCRQNSQINLFQVEEWCFHLQHRKVSDTLD